MIKGLHHLTATVSDTKEDLVFYTGFLGLRLVKKTINFDNTKVYHFYYGNESGTPGTIMTTFPYKGQQVNQGKKGHGQVGMTSLSVPIDSKEFWVDRFDINNINYETNQRFGYERMVFQDPSGIDLALVFNDEDKRPSWDKVISSANAIKGLHSITLSVKDPEATHEFLVDHFDAKQISSEGKYALYKFENNLPGYVIEVREDSHADKGINGIGTVHHVAFKIENKDQQIELRGYLINKLGLKVTEIKDRKYFTSIYFRIPGGVLFEVATINPGFALDENPLALGANLMLPEWEEPNRSAIEKNLPSMD